MGGDSRGPDGKEDRPERFADLIGEARPIRRGPERIAPDTRRTRRPPAGRSVAAESPRCTTKTRAEREGSVDAAGPRFRWPDPDEPGRAAASGVSDARLAALARGEPEPEERIDLHGLRRDTAGRVLVGRIESARARGLRSLLVIHGRGRRSPTGEAVLRDAVPGWLSGGPCARHVLAFTPAPDRLGGRGATLVLLRRPDR
ncbi:MAG TPA: hypothetical protein ENI85_09275 [Deltaproteobacteria bacterium]|nr:hypothetical protein [Deltaproteobacteria bacterium]